MGIYDREYTRPSGGRAAGIGGWRHWTIVQWLLAVNIAVFVLGHVVLGSLPSPRGGMSLVDLGAYRMDLALYGGQVWRFFTYQFLHAGFLHLVTNMLGLYFFGPLVENLWGRRRFLAFYLLCGASGALVMSVLSAVPGLLEAGPQAILVGASGSIFGILIVTAMKYPDLEIQLLFPPIPMKMKTFALGLLAISVVVILARWRNAGGEAAHLGGAMLGYLLLRHPHWLDWCERHPRALRRTTGGGTTRADIDRVLDKISRDGIHSLNAEERRILDRAREDLLK